MSAFKRLFLARIYPPAATTESFAGKTILITGASSGLGFEAAKKLVGLDVSNLIVTARNEEKAHEAKSKLDRLANANTKITALVLSMDDAAHVTAFVESLRAENVVLDAVILNAGVSQAKYEQSKDGFEMSLQVNAISTLLLGVYLLEFLLKRPPGGSGVFSKLPHLTFISSANVWRVTEADFEMIKTSPSPLKVLSKAEYFPPGKFGGLKVYSRSKAVLEYGVRHLAQSPVLQSSPGAPKVVINTVCPGLISTGLGRQFRGTNVFLQLFLMIFYFIFSRNISHGANSYISALTRGPECHGQMWKDDMVYKQDTFLLSEEGLRVGDLVWADTVKTLEEIDPRTRNILST